MFGRINVVYFHDIKKHVAQKVVSLDKCSKLSVMAEAAILHLLSGHFLFPYCYGFQRPNMIFLEKLGQFKDDYLDVCIIKTIIGKCQVSKYQWVSISRQDLEGISFLHQLTILHNDIKADNVILWGELRTAVTIIDFGKIILLSNLLKYSLNHAERMKYKIYHKHLAYELRNETNTYQSVLADIYSIGYMLQLVGAFEKFDFFENVGKQMKSRRPIRRMSIDAEDKELDKFIQSYTFC